LLSSVGIHGMLYMKNTLQIIDNKNKIINILNLLIKTNAIFTLRFNLMEYQGKLKEMTDTNFIFEPHLEIPGASGTLRFSFYYLNKYHYFDAVLYKAEEKELIVNIPDKVFIHTKRQHKRYDVIEHDINCNLKIINLDTNISLEKEIRSASPSIKSMFEELKKDNPDFKRIVQLIYEDNNKACDSLKIFMNMDTLPDQNVASFLKENKQPLLLNGLYEIKYAGYSRQKKEEDAYLGLKDYISFLSKDKKQDVKSVILDLIQYYKKHSIYSLLYVPILLFWKVIGVLRVSNNGECKRLFNINDVNHFISIARIINESIIKNRLNSLKDDSISIKVNNISMSGIGIEIRDNILAKFLKKNTKVRVFLDNNQRPWLSFAGFITRIISKRDAKQVGIEINEILPENHAKLINFINKNFGN